MSKRTQSIKLGIFVVATLGAFALVLAAVTGRTLFKERTTYYVVSEGTVAGLEVGSLVTVQGVRAGRVEEIELDRKDYGRVVVAIAVDPEVPIPRNAEAKFLMEGFTGRKMIDITGERLVRAELPPGGTIPRGTTAIEQIEKFAVSLAEEAVSLAGQGDELLENLTQLTEDIAPEDVRELFVRTAGLLERLNAVAGALQGVVEENRPGLRRAIGSAARSAERAEELFQQADVAVAELRMLIGTGSSTVRRNAADVDATVENLRQASRNLQDLSRELKMRPSRLLFSRPPEERELP